MNYSSLFYRSIRTSKKNLILSIGESIMSTFKYNYFVDFSEVIRNLDYTFEVYLDVPWTLQQFPDFKENIQEKHIEYLKRQIKNQMYFTVNTFDKSAHIAIRNKHSISICSLSDTDCSFRIQDNSIILGKNSLSSLHLLHLYIRDSIEDTSSGTISGRMEIKNIEEKIDILVIWLSLEISGTEIKHTIPVTIDLQGDIEVNLPEKIKNKKQLKKDIIEFMFYHLIPAY